MELTIELRVKHPTSSAYGIGTDEQEDERLE
jgi:hypothetical protein